MKTRTLGRTRIQVSPYCLGTMMFGQVGNPDQDDCVRIIHRALEAGINFIDTADVYSYSESEQIVGKALQGRRDDVVLATKVNGSMGDDPNRAGSSRRWIIAEVEHSLRRLRVDHIDLYQVQPPYSIVNRGIEREVLPVCERFGMGALVWSPLAMGVLSGRYRKGQPTQSPRLHWVPKHLTDERTLDVVEELIALADSAGMSIAHMSMAFAVAHPGVTSAIIGPRTMEQLDDLLAGAASTLDDEVPDKIDALVPPGPTLVRSTCPIHRQPSRTPGCVGDPPTSAPQPDRGAA